MLKTQELFLKQALRVARQNDMAEKKKNMIDCQEVMQNLFLFLDHEVDEMTEEEISHHLTQCQSCLSRVKFEKGIEESIRKAEDTKASSGLHDRVGKILKKL
jgi:anti-sigma factor (TIGR02949 family)